jgi:hypothetical protein
MGGLAYRLARRAVDVPRGRLRFLEMLTPRQQLADLLIRRLSEVLVPVADSVKGFRGDRADDLVDFCFQLFASLGRGGRYRHDDMGGPVLPQRHDGCAHRSAGRQTVIDQDHSTTTHIERRTTAAVSTLAPRQLLAFLCSDSVDYVVRNAQILDDLIVQDPQAAGRNRTHGQLFVPGDAKLADDKDVQRRVKRLGHFKRDRHAAARQRQYDHIRAIGVSGELCGQQPPRFAAITEPFGCHISPLPWPPDHPSARYRWTEAMVHAPSPTAEAQRLIEPARTSPAAKTPGRLVSIA